MLTLLKMLDDSRFVTRVFVVGHHDDDLVGGAVRHVQLLADPVHEAFVGVAELAYPGVPIPGDLGKQGNNNSF